MSAVRQTQIARLELLARAHPDSRVVLHLAEAHRRAGQLDRARRVLEDGLARRPDDAAARVLLGRVLLDLGRWSEAQQAFRAALAGRPEHMEIVALRAIGELAALWRSEAALGGREAGEARGAAAEAEHGAVQPAPPHPSRGDAAGIGGAALLGGLPWEELTMVTETLAELYAAQGLTGQAIALYRELLAARPGDARIRERLRELTGEHGSVAQRDAVPADSAPTPASAPVHDTPAELPRATPASGLEIDFVRMGDPAAEAAGPAPPVAPDAKPVPDAAPMPDVELMPEAAQMPDAGLMADADLMRDAEQTPDARPARDAEWAPAPAADDLDWLFSPAAPPPAAPGADAWTHLTTLADLALDALDEHRAAAAAAARHVRRLACAAAHELGMDASAVAALELAAQLLGIAAPAAARPDAWIAAAAARIGPLDLPADATAVLHHAAALTAGADDAAHEATAAARVLGAAVVFRAELARRGAPRTRALRETGAALWQHAGSRFGRDVVAALLHVVARDPTLAFPAERRVLILGDDDVLATAIAQPFRVAGDRVERARSLGRAAEALFDAGDCAAVVVLPGVGADAIAHLARELAARLERARPVIVVTGIADAGSRTALLAAGADLCFAPDAAAAEVHAATAALLRRLDEAGARAGAPAVPEPGARTGVRPGDNAGTD